MNRIPAMVDMRRSDAEKAEDIAGPSVSTAPDYPWGLRITLTEAELAKLGLTDDVGVGDMLHMHCMATVVSVSKCDSDAGPTCRVELQITHIVGEDEDEENVDPGPSAAGLRRRMYG